MSNQFISYPKYSCALGAQQTVIAIPKGVPILHSGPGCSSKIAAILGQGQSYAGGSTVPCTNADANDVIFGGVKALDQLIENTLQIIDGELFVVLTGCTSDIIGDDVASIVKPYQARGKPIVYVETGGFKSNNYVSHSAVVNAIIDQYVEKYKTGTRIQKGLVNVFASLPDQDPYFEGNLEELKRILESIGLTVNILFGVHSRGVEEWKQIPQAEFNLVVNTWAGLDIAKHLEKKYGTPYFHFPYFPIGAQQTSDFLRKVTEFGRLDRQRTEQFIQKEEERFYIFLERMADFVLEFKYSIPRRFYTISDAAYGIGLSKFLVNELGILPGAVYIVDDTPAEYQQSIREELKNISEYRSVEPVFAVDGEKILQEIEASDKREPYIILGSAWEAELAKRDHAGLLEISVPVQYRLNLNCTLLGYNGGLRVIEDIYSDALRAYR